MITNQITPPKKITKLTHILLMKKRFLSVEVDLNIQNQASPLKKAWLGQLPQPCLYKEPDPIILVKICENKHSHVFSYKNKKLS